MALPVPISIVFSVDLIWRSVHRQNEGWHDMAIATITISGITKNACKWLLGKNVQFSDHFNGNISIAGPQSSLIFYGAYNKTDTTTGALQFVDGMTLFYCSGLHGRQYPFEVIFSRFNFGALWKVTQMKMLWFLNRVQPLFLTVLHKVFFQKRFDL